MPKKIIYRTPQQVVKLWVNALESGEYQQTQKFLRKGDSFCCLGVLCDLAAKDGGEKWTKHYKCNYSGELDFPPEYITDYVGLSCAGTEHLASLNDQGQNFKQIAKVIRKGYNKETNEFNFQENNV